MSARFTFKPIAAAVLMASLVNAPAWADPGIREQLTTVPGRQISRQDESAISSAAVKVLRHIAAARGDLQGDKPDTGKAEKELEQTDRLLDIIQAALPTTVVKDRIWVAKKHLEYEDSHEVLPDLVPIYSSLDELVDYMPTAKAKSHLDQAKEALKQNDKPKAQRQLDATDDALVYVEADLPMATTRHLVGQARADLAKGDAKAAGQALITAEDNVVFVSVSFQSPLTHAKTALWRAWQDANLGDQEYAKADLNEAVKYLEQAADSKDATERKAAGELVSEVRDLNQFIESGDKDFSTRLKSSWHRLQALSERSTEYLSTGWQRLRAEGAGKKELIEAKLQLAYARIDHLFDKDDAAAKVDLAAAKGYLDTAAEQGNADIKSKVQEISTEVQTLEKELGAETKNVASAAPFQKAEAQLAALIRQL